MKMPLKCAWIAGLLIMALPFWAKGKKVNYHETAKLGEFLQEQVFEQNTLVILDLDDTTITTPEGQWLGRSEMFYDLLTREQKRHPEQDKATLASAIDPLLISIYEQAPVIPTDSSLPEVLRSLIKQGVTVVALTARGRGLREVTLGQLERVDVQLSDLGESRWVDLGGNRTFRVEKSGVIFASHGNKKGEVLVRLLEEGFFEGVKNIFLVDDRKYHLEDVGETLQQYKPDIQFTPVHCNYLNGKKTYDASEADRQLMTYLVDHKNESAIKHLLDADPYTQKIINNCSSILPERKKECLSFRK